MQFRSLAADDIFISYTRLDASTYATGLADELTKKGFSCFIDKLGTDPDKDLPGMLLRKIRNSAMLVVVCTERAGTRQTIEDEIKHFLRTGRRSSVVLVDFAGAVYGARWYKLVEGIAPEPETNLNALNDGDPSPSVVSRIEKQFNYKRRNERLRRTTLGAAALLVLLLLAGAGAGVYAARQLSNANTARAEAGDAKLEAKNARLAADKAKTEAETARRDADAATEKAAAKTRLADAAGLRARAAESARATAQAEAERQQIIGDSRSLANRSQALLRQRPKEVPRSLSLAVDSAQKSSAISVHLVEADTALRDSLALLSRLRDSHMYADASNLTALSPDGRHFAMLSDKLRIYDAGKQTPLKEVDCQCSAVALSRRLDYAAGILTEGGIIVINLKDNSRTHVVKLEEGVSAEKIALSPGGRYIALSFNEGEDLGQHSIVRVLDAATGKPIKSFDDLDMRINDIAFGSGGNLAVGGKYISPQGGRFTGRVAIWPLLLDASDGKAEPDLTDESFPSPEVIPQESEVAAVAPGGDTTYFATDTGVWKRRSGETSYGPVARLPYSRSYESSSSIERLAFGPDGRSLALVRYIQATGNDATLEGEEVFEAWDATGHWDLTQVFHSAEIARVGFKPGGQSVATMTENLSGEEPVRLFRTDNGEKEESTAVRPEPEDGQVLYVSPDAGHFVTAREGVAVVWDVWGRKKKTARFGDGLQGVEAAAVSSNGKYLALSGPNKDGGVTIVVYRSDGGSYGEWKKIPQNATPLTMSLSTDGQRLAVLYRYDINFVRIWDVVGRRDRTPKSLLYLSEIASESFSSIPDIRLMALSPSGRFLVTTDGHDRSQLLDLSNGREVALFDDTKIESVAFSLKDRYVALGSDEGIVHIFDTGRPEDEIARLRHTGIVTAIAFSDDARYVATASSDRHPNRLDEEESYPVRVWLLQPKDLVAEASARLASLRASTR